MPLDTKGNRTEEEWKRTVVTPIHVRVINVLHLWIRSRFPDFDYALIKKINTFIDENLMKDGHENWAKSLVKLIRRKVGDSLRQLIHFLIRSTRSNAEAPKASPRTRVRLPWPRL